MDAHTLGHQLGLSLLIGAEVFVIAALWPLSELAANAWRGRWFVVALAVAAACLALDTHAVAFARGRGDPLRWGSLDDMLDALVIPLFLVFPDAVCVVSAQSLHRAGAPARWARGVALAVGLLAAAAAPVALIAASCGLAGACF